VVGKVKLGLKLG